MNTIRIAVWLGLALCFSTVGEIRAFYNPQNGRWLSRDPIEEKGGNCLHAFANNSPVANFDSDGRITVTRAHVDVQRCNLVEYAYRYTLDFKPCDKGWIVQEISFYLADLACCYPVPPPPNRLLFHIWEAFPIEKGADTWTSPYGNWTDGFRYRNFPNLQGALVANFTIQFYCDTGFNDLGIAGWRTTPDRERGIDTGGLPWSDQWPSFWGTESDDQPAYRSVTVDWDCCPNQIWNPNSNP